MKLKSNKKLVAILSFWSILNVGYSQDLDLKDYKIVKDIFDADIILKSDLDKDGIIDVVTTIQKPNDDEAINYIAINLTSLSGEGKYRFFPFGHTNDEIEITYNNDVLNIVKSSNKPFSETLKFKFYSDINVLRLIGYDFVITDPVRADANNYSINFLTNEKIEVVKSYNKKTQVNYSVISFDNITEELLKGFSITINTQPKNTAIKPVEKVYKSIAIGNQEWMQENLNVTTFRNGDKIPQAKTNDEWKLAAKEKKPAWCYYKVGYSQIKVYGDPEKSGKYGKMYNYWAMADKRGIAPNGWHIPTIVEWGTFFNNYQDKKQLTISLKNEFRVMFGGNRGADGGFYRMGDWAGYWSSSNDGTYPYCVTFYSDAGLLGWEQYKDENGNFVWEQGTDDTGSGRPSGWTDTGSGHYIRCVKD